MATKKKPTLDARNYRLIIARYTCAAQHVTEFRNSPDEPYLGDVPSIILCSCCGRTALLSCRQVEIDDSYAP